MAEAKTKTEDPMRSYGDVRTSYVEKTKQELAKMPERLTLEQADDYLTRFEQVATLHEDFTHIRRFCLGEVARRVKEQAEWGTIDDKLNRLANANRIDVNTMRYYMGAAKVTEGSLTKFDGWLKSGGYQKRFYHIRELSRMNLDVVKELGAESLAEEVLRRTERTAEDLQQLNDEHDRRNAAPAARRVASEAERARQNSQRERERQERERRRNAEMNGQPSPDETPGSPNRAPQDDEDPALEAFIRMVSEMDCPCGAPVEPGREGVKSDPHHVGPSGTATKNFPWARTNLCRECHNEYHANGYRGLYENRGVDIRAALAKTLYFWITGEQFRFPAGIPGA